MSQIQYDNLIEYDFDSLCKYSEGVILQSVNEDQSQLICNQANKKIQRNCWKIEIICQSKANKDMEMIERRLQIIQQQYNKKGTQGMSGKVLKFLMSNGEQERLVQRRKEQIVRTPKLIRKQMGMFYQIFLKSEIADQVPNRTDQIVKNYFYATVRRVLRRLLKAAGNKNCSELARQIKPCVLSRIFSFNEIEDDKLTVMDTSSTQLFRGLILKYRNISFSGSVNFSSEDQQNILQIFDNLTKINLQYVDEKQALQLQKCQAAEPQFQISFKNIQKKQKNQQELIDEVQYDDYSQIIIGKIVKKKPILTSTIIPIEKHYKLIQIVEKEAPEYVIEDQSLQMQYNVNPVYFTKYSEFPIYKNKIKNIMFQDNNFCEGNECLQACKPVCEKNQCSAYSTAPIQSIDSIFSVSNQQNLDDDFQNQNS
ncbi:hypothetical protein pb186bvf_006391 [Paramecium bursaria]